MVDQIMELVRQLCGSTESGDALRMLCGSACRLLDGMLADGVTPEDCAEEYQVAAAWIAMDWLKSGRDWTGVTSLSAGDLKVTRESGGQEGGLSRQAMALMGPYLRDRGFVFRGVRG